MNSKCSKCNKEFEDYCDDEKCPMMGYVDYSGTCGEYLTEDEE
tara:strand:+ start:622 stop:750 length:129 start_codon:yes stop_codon:yes gene_type:complete